MSRIGAVVVHWRDPAATLSCLASLTPEPEIDVPVVDNGSSDPLAVPRPLRAERGDPQLRGGRYPTTDGRSPMNASTREQPAARPGTDLAPPAPRLGAASSWGVELAAFAVITAAAVVATWPLARYAGSRVPWNLIDSLENVWIFGWTAHALAHQPLRLFDANMFHPEHTTLAFAENMLGIGIVAAPVCWLSGNPILAANLATLLVYAVGGYGVYLLVHEIGGLRAPTLLAGVAFTITPYRALNVVHLHVIGTHLTPYVLALLVALRSSRPTRRRVVGVGLLVALQFWSSLTASLLTVVAAAVVVVWELARRRRASFPFLRAAGAGLAPAILLGGLVLLPYLQVKRDHPEFQQPASAVLTYSATP